VDEAPDTTPPSVVSTVPVAGAAAVAAGSNVEVVFSEAMKASTISSTTFSLLKQGAVTPVAAAVSYDSATTKATLDPAAVLEAGATYVATVKGGGGGVQDAAGIALAVDKTWSFTVATTPPPVAQVVYRVNVGGASVAATPVWSADTAAAPSSFVNAAATGNTTYSTVAAINTSSSSIPSGTPAALFANERFDASAAPEMQWVFPVTAGRYEVRLYFAEIYFNAVGARKFDVSVEGAKVLSGYDIFADVGANKAVMKTFTVTSDANLNIDFAHAIENPTLTAIEILNAP
jgi:hypothetical protein